MKMLGRRLNILIILLLGLGAFILAGEPGLMAEEEALPPGSVSAIENIPAEKNIANIIQRKRFAEKEAEILKRTHFHNYIVEEMPVNPNPAFCFVCHGNYPHANAKQTRAILNMHCVFCACETCHFRFDPKERAQYGFRWYDGTTKIQGDERHYGTEYDVQSGRVLMEPGKTVSKITPYKMWEGKYYMINLRMDSPEAQAYLRKKGSISPAQQAAFKARLHTSISTKGRECGECHAVDGVINYKALGFDSERIKDLTGLNIAGMVSKYQKFYIPDIFKQQQMFESPLEEDIEEEK